MCYDLTQYIATVQCCSALLVCACPHNVLHSPYDSFPFHSPAGRAYSNAHFGVGSGPIFLDDVQCTSSSSQLLECPSRPILSHNCRHVYDAGVGCDGNLIKQATGARKHTYVYRNILETQNFWSLV